MLEQVLTEIRNWFQVGIYRDKYTIQDGSITLPFLQDGQYFRIMGSVFNDGLHRYTVPAPPQEAETPDDKPTPDARDPEDPKEDPLPKENRQDDMALTDETFIGTIWALAVPKAVIDMAGEIEEWQKKYGEKASSPYVMESFGGYSYTKSAGATQSSSGGSGGWEAAFRARLNPYRKLREV